MKTLQFLLLQVLVQAVAIVSIDRSSENIKYGVDISWPMHSFNVSTNYAFEDYGAGDIKMPVQPLGNRQSVYDNFMEGCFAKYGFESCDERERDRVATNVDRIQYMVNFTTLGFTKMKAPTEMFKALLSFWEDNEGMQVLESNGSGETTNNHWESPAYFLDIDDKELIGGGDDVTDLRWSSVEDSISDWVNLPLRISAVYGIRVYTENAMLNSHIDALPRISSAIINVAQDVDEDWPLEVIGHDGRAYNITMQPGDMVLYESHSLIHGRPFALKGRYYANLFIHFEPNETHHGRPLYITDDVPIDVFEDLIKMAEDSADSKDNTSSDNQEESNDNKADSKDSAFRDNEEFKDSSHVITPKYLEDENIDIGTVAHHSAANNDIKTLINLSKTDESSLLFKADSNGWTPLHEAVRAGHADIIHFLIANGADLYTATTAGELVFDLAQDREIFEILESYKTNEDIEEL